VRSGAAASDFTYVRSKKSKKGAGQEAVNKPPQIQLDLSNVIHAVSSIIWFAAKYRSGSTRIYNHLLHS